MFHFRMIRLKGVIEHICLIRVLRALKLQSHSLGRKCACSTCIQTCMSHRAILSTISARRPESFESRESVAFRDLLGDIWVSQSCGLWGHEDSLHDALGSNSAAPNSRHPPLSHYSYGSGLGLKDFLTKDGSTTLRPALWVPWVPSGSSFSSDTTLLP